MPSRLPSIALVALILIAAIGCEAQPQWVHITLASSEHRIGEYSIDGDWIAWVEKERFGRSPDIFLFDGKTVRQLTNDGEKNTQPHVSDGYVVWQARSEYRDVDGQIKKTRLLKIYDGQAVRELKTSISTSMFDVSGRNIVWTASDGEGDSEVLFYDGERTRRLTDNEFHEQYPQISGSNVVWRAPDGQNWHVYLWREGEITRVTDGTIAGGAPKISGERMVWSSQVNGSTEVFLYDGQTVRQLTGNGQRHDYPRIDGDAAVWQGFDGNDWEVFLFNGQTVRQITDNQHDDVAPRINDGNVVWLGRFTERREDTEVFLYDGSAITRVTNDYLRNSPATISGSRIVYGRSDGQKRQIMVAVPADDPWVKHKDHIERSPYEDIGVD